MNKSTTHQTNIRNIVSAILGMRPDYNEKRIGARRFKWTGYDYHTKKDKQKLDDVVKVLAKKIGGPGVMVSLSNACYYHHRRGIVVLVNN